MPVPVVVLSVKLNYLRSRTLLLYLELFLDSNSVFLGFASTIEACYFLIIGLVLMEHGLPFALEVTAQAVDNLGRFIAIHFVIKLHRCVIPDPTFLCWIVEDLLIF